MKSLKINTMTRIFLAGMVMTIALALGSCASDTALPGKKQGGSEQQLRLKVNIPQLGIQTGTRATVESEPGEDEVGKLFLLFFAAGGGEFVDYVEVNDAPVNISVPLDLSTHPLIVVSDPYDILAVGNIDDEQYINGDAATWMQQWYGMTMEEVKDEARAWIEGGSNNAGAIAPEAILMSGKTAKGRDQFDISVDLVRNMVRFDIVNNAAEEYDLASAEIWNAYSATSIWGGTENFSPGMARITRFYGMETRSASPDAMMGGLYAFENQSIAPSQNDRVTTCLIVALRNTATSETTYHRVNISPTESAQVLKKNNVYRLTIRGVNAGSATAQEAYEAAESGLDYAINYWDMHEYGLIIQDGNSILSIPTKTITIGETGGTLSYEIFTFNNSGATSTLTLKSQKFDPEGSITATLHGSTLTVHATALGTADMRTGTIVVSYAGLEGTINVVQNRGDGAFLTVNQPVGGVSSLAPYAGIGTGDIRVDASGPWTAELFMPDGGFTFDATTPGLEKAVIQSSDPLVTNNNFKVYTSTANPGASKRECYVLVTLDSDPANYASVVMLSQAPTGGISLVPNSSSVTFNGMGDGLAAISGNTTDVFNVRPSMEDDGNGGEQIANWLHALRVSGAHDDTAMFTVTPAKSTTDAGANTVTVAAVGPNYSGRQYSAILRLYLEMDNTTFTEITLVQQPLGITLSPGMIPAVGIDGGETGLISVAADASLQWSATVETISGTSGDGRSLVAHQARLVDGNGTAIVPGQLYPMSTQMRVVFPKVYYPNRGIPISARVTATVQGMTNSITVEQTPLTAGRMVGYGMTGLPAYGGLGDTYNRGWDGTSGNYGLAQVSGYSRLGVGNMTASSIPAGVNYLHVAAHIIGASGDTYNWSVVNDFIDNRDGWTVLTSQDTYGRGPMNNANSPLKRNGAGYNDLVYSAVAGWAKVRPDQSTTPRKVYQYVMDKGVNALTPASFPNTGFYVDGVANTIQGPWPESAVVLMTKINNENHAILLVDIEHKFLWMGESQVFWNDTYLTNNRGAFLQNLICFVANASKYGSHFTDLLLEDGAANAQPAPWDSYWGDNAKAKATFD